MEYFARNFKFFTSKCLSALFFRGFPSRSLSTSSIDYCNDEAIYRNLRDDAEDNEPVVENCYDIGTAEEEKAHGRIYDTIVCQRSSGQRGIKASESDVHFWFDFLDSFA